MRERGLRGRHSWMRRTLGTLVVVGAALGDPPVVWADEAIGAALPEQLVLENGVRVIIAKTSRPGPVAVALAVRSPSAPSAPSFDDAAALVLGDLAPRGELAVTERAALESRRDVRSSVATGDGVAFRVLEAAGDELPLLLYLTGQALRDARWDEATWQRARAATAVPGSEASVAWGAVRRVFGRPSPTPAGPSAASPWEQLAAWDGEFLRSERVITVVGDIDTDRVAELAHHYLDTAPARSSRGDSSAPMPVPSVAAAPVRTVPSPAFATTLAFRLVGPPARRRALRIAFDAFLATRLASITKSSSCLMVNRLDEQRVGAQLVAVRLVATDAAAADRQQAGLLAALSAWLDTGPTEAELAAATSRLSLADGRTAAPGRVAVRLALGELAGERSGAAPGGRGPLDGASGTALTAASKALLAEAFGERQRFWLLERQSP